MEALGILDNRQIAAISRCLWIEPLLLSNLIFQTAYSNDAEARSSAHLSKIASRSIPLAAERTLLPAGLVSALLDAKSKYCRALGKTMSFHAISHALL